MAESFTCRFNHGDDEYGDDTTLRDVTFESGEEGTFGTVAEE